MMLMLLITASLGGLHFLEVRFQAPDDAQICFEQALGAQGGGGGKLRKLGVEGALIEGGLEALMMFLLASFAVIRASWGPFRCLLL